MNIVQRNNIKLLGKGPQTLIFAHGYGCDQNVWRRLVPAFERDYQILLFDHAGSGQSDLSCYDRVKYGTLHGYADDILEICDVLEISNAIFIGHSVACMMGVLASVKNPKVFEKMVLMAPSPSFLNDGEYVGGFERFSMHEMLESVEKNYFEWSKAIAPLIMGAPERPDLTEELVTSFCSNKPEIAKHFAHVAFLSDCREDIQKLSIPALILQCTHDALAPLSVGQYMHRQIPDSDLHQLKATGHCPHMSAPNESIVAIKTWLHARPV